MTKFEEELKKVANAGIDINRKEKTYYERDILRLSKGWVSPEDYQARVDELIEAKDKYTKLLYENSSLKSQLQQQALPVVPECVGEYIKTKLDKSKNLQDLYDEPLFHTGEAYLSGSEYNFISWFNENTTLFEKAWTNGYTVEKAQLFYLKNMLTGLYLACDAEGYLEAGRTVAEKFTQQEIDSMQTGSYELIEVEK